MARKKRPSFWKRYGVEILILIAAFSFISTVGYAFFTLPSTDNLENLNLIRASEVYDRNGKLISKLFEENRTVVTLNNMSIYLQQAVIANEDVRFYSHVGIDPIGILRAAWVDIKSGSLAEGGSTITQQLAKNMFLTQEKSLIRKIKEALLALMIENRFTKQEILQAYLNQIYFGEGAYGVEAAAQLYFGKSAKQLNLAESALLAGLPRGPGIYSPYTDLQAALKRRSEVLAGLVKEGYITTEEAKQANSEPIVLAGKKKRVIQASYFLDYVSHLLVEKYGANRVYKGGLKIYTTLDTTVQEAAESTLADQQGAIISLDPRTGAILAMVGGKDYSVSQVNRALTEIRQPGSAFKPFVYATALNQGLSMNALSVDEPISIAGYAPQNYDKKYLGPVTLHKALRASINTVAVKLGQQVGMENVLTLAQALGIRTIQPQDNNLASALGGLTQGVKLIELTAAYTAFANQGIYSEPVAILKVVDENGVVLEENSWQQQPLLRPDIAYLMTTMMVSVINDGTGTAANIGRPAAGKTGTTDGYETAWFIGYTPEILTGIYLGKDDRSPVGLSGSQVAAYWGKLMTQALKNQPISSFPVPSNIISGITICSKTGQPPDRTCTDQEQSAFIRGTEPLIISSGKEPAMNKEKTKSKWPFPWLSLPQF